MAAKFSVGDRVRVIDAVPGGTTRTPFFIRGKKGVVAYSHGVGKNPRDLSYGGSGEPGLHLYAVSFHMAHLYDEDPDYVHDRVVVDVFEDWLEPVLPTKYQPGRPIDRTEHALTYYEERARALGNLLGAKGIMNVDESRRLVAELDAQKRGTRHPMVSPP